MDSPLTTAHYKKTNDALGRLSKVRLQIEAAQRAGLPVDELIRVADWYEESLGKLKAEYFKGKP